MKGVADEFKQFIMRGNVVDLAIAVVIGAAFGAVITSLVENMVTPLIAAIGGQPDFSDISFTINGSTFGIGLFLNALISFVIIAAVIFFFVVKPLNSLMARVGPKPEAAVDAPTCPSCLEEVKAGATRCPHCTAVIAAATA